MTHETGTAGEVVPAETQQVSSQHTHFHDDLYDFWNDVPALSWLMNLETGTLQVRGTHSGAGTERLVPVQHEELARALLRHLKDGPAPLRILEVLPTAEGEMRHFLIVGFPIGVETANPYFAGVAIDITRQKLRVNELAQQALMDELTGLYNLRGFLLFAEHELKIARRRGTRSAILYVDVDGLKKINDAHGHERGSAVLVETAAVLRRVFRECDVIARLGGDEFAVFAANVHGDPELLRKRLGRAMEEFSAAADGPALSVSAGVGSSPADPGLQLTDLLIAADQAMYKDKFEKFERAPIAAGGLPGA